jgi:hypothetical protein
MEETGEQLFERLCTRFGLGHTRISEAAKAGEQRPDYRVIGTDGSEFVAEVKLVTPTSEEARDIERIHRGEIFVTGATPGERLRRLIGKANQQLKALAEKSPGILFVFNPEFLLRRHTEPYAVLTAMRGLDVVDVQVPRDPRLSPQFGSLRSGPGKKMTEDANTSTSAVVCPVETRDGEWHVDVYHNRFAARQLCVSALQGETLKHWEIADNERDWAQITGAV